MSEVDLAAVLDHCRALAAGADHVAAAARDRDAGVSAALVGWRGPLAREFAGLASDEAADLDAVVQGLRDEADCWAQVWADTVNAENRARRQAQAELVVDVAVPSAAAGYAPTGGLEPL